MSKSGTERDEENKELVMLKEKAEYLDLTWVKAYLNISLLEIRVNDFALGKYLYEYKSHLFEYPFDKIW